MLMVKTVTLVLSPMISQHTLSTSVRLILFTVTYTPTHEYLFHYVHATFCTCKYFLTQTIQKSFLAQFNDILLSLSIIP